MAKELTDGRTGARKGEHAAPGSGSPREILIGQFESRYSDAGIRQRRLNRILRSNLWIFWIHLISATRRAFDIVSAAVLLLILAPVLTVLYARIKARREGLRGTKRLGRWGRTFREFEFTSGPFRRLPALFNILRGDLSLVGPRPVSPGEISAEHRAAWRRFSVRPGLICLWWLRRRANIAWSNEFRVDSEYLDNHSLRGDLAIMLRAIPAALYGEGVVEAPDRINLLGIPVDNLTMEEAIETILDRAHGKFPSQLCFVNADCVNIARRDSSYKDLLMHAGVVLADGIGVKLAGKFLNTHIRQNVTVRICFRNSAPHSRERGRAADRDLSSWGKPGVAEDVKRWVERNYPGVLVKGQRNGFFSAGKQAEVLEDIRNSGAEILLVAMGAPRQDKWIRDHLAETGVGIAMGVGGLFDFYSGRIPRAPVWMREIGMEWLYRFWQEPRRMWRRYFVGNFVFLCRVMSRKYLTGVAE